MDNKWFWEGPKSIFVERLKKTHEIGRPLTMNEQNFNSYIPYNFKLAAFFIVISSFVG